MSLINFTKYHGLGNDFIVIENLDGRFDLRADIVRAICDRHFGVGADGLILVKESSVADYSMDYRNADGSVAEMCGNGIRVFAKYIFDHLRPVQTIQIETRAGIKAVELSVEAGTIEAITVNMGEPLLSPRDIPIVSEEDRYVSESLLVRGTEYHVTGVSMGNPHCVIFVADVDRVPVRDHGPIIEEHELFPAKTNVEFVQVQAADRLRLRVWERGVGETLACGTGACAALVAANLNGLTGRRAQVELPGGHLVVEWLDDDSVIMTGPANEVFSGQFDQNLLMRRGEES